MSEHREFSLLGENDRIDAVIILSAYDLMELAPEGADAHVVESEPSGQAFIHDQLQLDGEWVQTVDAAQGYSYDRARGVAVPPQPYPSWTLDLATNRWEPPVPYPGENHQWYEEIGWLDHSTAVPPVAFTLEFTGTEIARMKASTDDVVIQLMQEVEDSKLVVKEHPRTIFGVMYLQENEYLDHANRWSEILGST